MSRIKKPSIVAEKNPNWKGGAIRKDGRVYVIVPDYPRPAWGNYVQRSRLVMEKHLGRYLDSEEIVHHKNRITDDDRLENLEVMGRVAHNQLHAHELEHLGKWSRKHDRCVECRTTEYRHKGNGVCTRCHDRKRWPARLQRQKERISHGL